jgi:asparagine synthetase B (glutamine-hydrolysing)
MAHLLIARVDDAARRRSMRASLEAWGARVTPSAAPPHRVLDRSEGPWVVAELVPRRQPTERAHRVASIGWPATDEATLAALGTGSVAGAGAVARWHDDAIEVATDTFASRSWFVGERQGIAVASTSQRLATLALGAFEPSTSAAHWFLATGVLPPGGSHNAQLRALPPATVSRCARQGRATWVDRTDRPAFRPTRLLAWDARATLTEAIESAVGSLSGASGWVSPLSGGVDSRALLLFWRGVRPPTLTWGTEAAREDTRSDAVVAAKVAEALGTAHRYVVVAPGRVAPAEVLRRFAEVGEGRIDHLGGYADGFAVFQTLADNGVSAIVRGDEAFGWARSLSTEDLYRSLGLSFGLRVRDLPPEFASLLADQRLPERFERCSGESLALWRDRLYANVRAPTVLAALNALKAPWVEIANPFLHRNVAAIVRTLPDRWRTDKALFREVVAARGLAIPYARTPAIAAAGDVIGAPDARALLAAGLDTRVTRAVFGEAQAERLAAAAAKPGAPPRGRREWMERVRAYVPGELKAPARVIAGAPRVPWRAWAFRAWLTTVTLERLEADASAGASVSARTG